MSEPNSETKPIKFCESLDGDLAKPGILERYTRTPWVKRYLKEGLYKDAAPILGEMEARVSEAVYGNAVGRNLAWVVPTNTPSVRFYKTTAGVAERLAEGVPPPLLGPKPSYTDVSADYEIGTRVSFSLSAIEDMPLAVRQQLEVDAGKALAAAETDLIEAVIGAIAHADLAGGDEWTAVNVGHFAYADVLTLYGYLDAEGYVKDGDTLVCAMNPAQAVDQLLKDTEFINSTYKTAAELGSLPGAFSMSAFNILFVKSSLLTAATTYLINPKYALGMPVRREPTVIPWETSVTSGFDVVERFGLGSINTKAVARMSGA